MQSIANTHELRLRCIVLRVGQRSYVANGYKWSVLSVIPTIAYLVISVQNKEGSAADEE